MPQAARQVASQVLFLHGEQLILPNTAVAEIIPYIKPEALSDMVRKNAPEWLLGMISWRGILVPLISIETIFGSDYEQQGKRSSIAIINAVGSATGVPYFAIVTQGIPRLLQVSATTLNVIDETGDDNKAIACHVVIEGDVAIIPDMDEIENLLKNAFTASPSNKPKSKTKKKITAKEKAQVTTKKKK